MAMAWRFGLSASVIGRAVARDLSVRVRVHDCQPRTPLVCGATLTR